MSTENVQATTQTQANTQDVSAQQSPAAGAPASELEAMRAQLVAARSELERARGEAAKYRTRNDEETAAKLKEQGDYKALWESKQADLEKAKRYDAWAEKQSARIESEKETIPSYLRKALENTSSIEAKLEILDEWKASQAQSQPQPKQTQTPPTQGAPGVNAPKPNLQQLLDAGWSVARIKAERPDALENMQTPIASRRGHIV